MPSSTTTIRFDTVELARIDGAADRAGMNRSELIKAALEIYIRERGLDVEDEDTASPLLDFSSESVPPPSIPQSSD